MVGQRYEVLFEAHARDGATRGKTRGNKDVVVLQPVVLGEVKNVVIREIRGRTPIGELMTSYHAVAQDSVR
jgi:hypothetical protein